LRPGPGLILIGAVTESRRVLRRRERSRILRAKQNNARNLVETAWSMAASSTALAGDSLGIIIQMSEHVGSMVTNIATAAAEQSATTESINSNVDQIAKITAAQAAGVQQTSQALEDFSDLAMNLQQLIGQFRLESNGRGQNGGNGRFDRKDRGEMKPSRVVATAVLSRTP
jgi:hypothetical protein